MIIQDRLARGPEAPAGPPGASGPCAVTSRYVATCPGAPANKRRVPLGVYVAAVRMAIANPDREFRHGLSTWWPTTGAEIRRQFRAGMHDRINMRGDGSILRHRLVPR